MENLTLMLVVTGGKPQLLDREWKILYLRTGGHDHNSIYRVHSKPIAFMGTDRQTKTPVIQPQSLMSLLLLLDCPIDRAKKNPANIAETSVKNREGKFISQDVEKCTYKILIEK